MTASYRPIITAAVLALAACTSQPAPPVLPPAANLSAWDGTYRGTIQLTHMGSGIQKSWCETDPVMEVHVSGGTFSYAQPHPATPGNWTPVYAAVVRPDGSVSAQLASGSMTGRVIGAQMAGTIDGAACVYGFTLNRV